MRARASQRRPTPKHTSTGATRNTASAPHLSSHRDCPQEPRSIPCRAGALASASPGPRPPCLPDGRIVLFTLGSLRSHAAADPPVCPPGRAGVLTDLHVQISELLLSTRSNSIQAAAIPGAEIRIQLSCFWAERSQLTVGFVSGRPEADHQVELESACFWMVSFRAPREH